MQRLHPEEASRALVHALTDGGLHAWDYTRNGCRYVHASPPDAPAAGTDVLCAPAREECTYVSEWGNQIGDSGHLKEVAAHVLWLFGLSRPRR